MGNDKLGRKYRIRIIWFYSLVILLLIGWVGLSFAFAYWIISLGSENFKLLLLAVFTVVYALSAVIVFLAYRPHKSHGIPVSQETAPQLFALITDTADKIGYNSDIEEVILTPGMSVSVNVDPTLCNFIFNPKAKLFIGVLVCRFLSKQELSAVIAHELAHFSQPKTKYKAYLSRVANISSRLGKNGIFGSTDSVNANLWGFYAWPARFFGYVFKHLFEVVFDINSADYVEVTADMELEADKISAQTIGSGYMLSALCKSYAISNRLVLYKSLILPYLSSCGYRCNGYWHTFEASYPLFEKIDKLDIRTEKLLLDLNQTHFDMSECIFALRLDSLWQMCDRSIYPTPKEAASDVIPASIQDKMDAFLCRKYGHDTGIPVGSVRMKEMIEALSAGIFAGINSLREAFLLLDELLSDYQQSEGESTPTLMPEYACPSYDVLPQPVIKQASDEIYSSAIDTCPVCGGEISEDTKVCPHCHEIISE